MKGQAQVTEILTTLGIAVLTVSLIFIVPKLLNDFIKMMILAKAEIVARDIAGLITVSGAAPEEIIIHYETPSEDITYNVDIDGRVVNVEMLGEEKIIEKSSSRSGVDPDTSLKDAKTFTILKIREGQKNTYDIFSGFINIPEVIPVPPVIPSPEMCPGSFFTLTPVDCGPGKIDLLEYYIPDFPVTNVIQHSSGHVEHFHTYLSSYESGKGVFYTTKSSDPIYFEEFSFDNQHVYHLKDTTWATGPNQNVKCENGDDAYFTLMNGFYGKDNCNVYKPEIEGGLLHPRCMSVGEVAGPYLLTVVGFSKKTCTCCKTRYVGNLPESVTFVSHGSVTFPTGWSSDDVVKLYKSTTQETYYYDKELGWVGFEGPGFQAYIKNTLPEARCATLQCSVT